MAALVKQAHQVGVILVAFALALPALAGCGGEARQTKVSTADVAAFIQVLVPFIASSECGELSDAARALQRNTSSEVDSQKGAEGFQRFADEAPDEIRGDLQAFADPYSNWGEALEAADALDGVDVTKPTPETLEKLQRASATGEALEVGADRHAMQKATHHLVAWMRVNCTAIR